MPEKKLEKAEPMETDAGSGTDSKKGKDSKATTPSGTDILTLEDLKEQCRRIERGEITKESSYITRVMRSLAATRKRITAPLLGRLVGLYFGATSHTKQREYLIDCVKIASAAAKAAKGAKVELESMDVDNAQSPAVAQSPSSTTGAPPRSPKPKRLLQGSQTASPPLAEIECYIHMLVALYLYDQKCYKESEECIDRLLKVIIPLNRRSLDPICGRVYYYHSLIYEKNGKIGEIREFLHARLRTSTLRHDEDSQAVLINCLLRSYLADNLYELAGKLVAKITYPETAGNNEWARYLFYLGCIKAMQLEYQAANKHLQQALRKSPQHSAAGFKQSVQKMLVVVELLLGEIPERHLFRQPIFRKSLQPYFLLTQAVRMGNVVKFNQILADHESTFHRDKTYSLIVRLRQNVIRTAVKKVSVAYNKITLADIAEKLHLNATDDAEFVVTKAIRDGVIEASVNHKEGYVQSREISDVYSTTEPQQQYHNRINFCLQIYNQSVKAMRFPPKSYNQELESAEERREREQQDLEYAKELAEDEEDEF